VAECCDAEHGRFKAMYEQHYPAVLRYAARRLDAEAARDIVAETFLTAWRRLDRVPPGQPLPLALRHGPQMPGQRAEVPGQPGTAGFAAPQQIHPVASTRSDAALPDRPGATRPGQQAELVLPRVLDMQRQVVLTTSARKGYFPDVAGWSRPSDQEGVRHRAGATESSSL
jgi:hypothetical protein